MPHAIATIGFTKSSAAHFFDRIKRAGVKKVLDVRLHHGSQLAGFAKSSDLGYFLKEICGVDYALAPLFAPTEAIMTGLRTAKKDWSLPAAQFMDLLAARHIERHVTLTELEGTCLLCAEATHHHCHRRLVVDYLNERWGGSLAVTHL